MQQLELIDLFVMPLEHHGFKYMVSGSVGSIFYGEPRLTHDVDIVLFVLVEDLKRFPEIFPPDKYYCPPLEVLLLEARRAGYAHFNLIHPSTGLKADCYPHTGDELEKWAVPRRKKIKIDKTHSIWLAPTEYIILKKLVYYREGKSQKHVLDIRKMLVHNPDLVKSDELLNWIEELSLGREWTKVMSE